MPSRPLRKRGIPHRSALDGEPLKERSQPAVEGALDRLRAIRGGLAPTAARIADFMLANAADVVHMSVTEVAEGARRVKVALSGCASSWERADFSKSRSRLRATSCNPCN